MPGCDVGPTWGQDRAHPRPPPTEAGWCRLLGARRSPWGTSPEQSKAAAEKGHRHQSHRVGFYLKNTENRKFPVSPLARSRSGGR